MPKILCPKCGTLLEVSIRLGAEIPSGKSAEGRFGLSAREAKCVDLAVYGCTNADIAVQMGIKEQVVKNYMRSAYDKIGCNNRADMVRVILLGRDRTSEAVSE